MDIDAQLYPDLGYGEIYHYASGTVFLPLCPSAGRKKRQSDRGANQDWSGWPMLGLSSRIGQFAGAKRRRHLSL